MPYKASFVPAFGTHTSLQGEEFVWEATATNSAPKKEGKHLLASKESDNIQKRQILPRVCHYSCAMFTCKTTNKLLLFF